MFDLSQQAANAAFGIFNIVLIIGAACVLIGTIGVIWAGGIREKYADERIRKNELDTATAADDAARANLQTEIAKLEQEKLKAQLAWRVLAPQSVSVLLNRLGASKGTVLLSHTANDPEAMYFAIQFEKIFTASGWRVLTENRTLANSIVFGILIPNHPGKNVDMVRRAFADAGVGFAINDLPPAMLTYVVSGNSDVTVFIGSKPPAL